MNQVSDIRYHKGFKNGKKVVTGDERRRAEAYSESSTTAKMKVSAKIVNGFYFIYMFEWVLNTPRGLS